MDYVPDERFINRRLLHDDASEFLALDNEHYFGALVDGPDLPWWFISLADMERPEGKRFVGGLFVRASFEEKAFGVAWRRRCHPFIRQGDARVSPVPDGALLPERFTYRLLSRAECEEAFAMITPAD